jgi:hypothetical protein
MRQGGPGWADAAAAGAAGDPGRACTGPRRLPPPPPPPCLDPLENPPVGPLLSDGSLAHASPPPPFLDLLFLHFYISSLYLLPRFYRTCLIPSLLRRSPARPGGPAAAYPLTRPHGSAGPGPGGPAPSRCLRRRRRRRGRGAGAGARAASGPGARPARVGGQQGGLRKAPVTVWAAAALPGPWGREGPRRATIQSILCHIYHSTPSYLPICPAAARGSCAGLGRPLCCALTWMRVGFSTGRAQARNSIHE